MLVHDRTAKYKSYCAQHDLTARIYRTQVAAYNKSISAKAAHAAAAARLRIQLRATGALPSGFTIHLNPLRISQAELSFDAEHINARQHRVTEAQAREWIERALFSVTVWRGEFERFYSELGAVYVNLRTNTIRTAYAADEYDERTKKLIEVYQDAKARKR